jgi:putative transposase
MTFVRNHSKAVVSCHFLVVVTATLRVLHVYVLIEVGSRRIVHKNLTAHLTADWKL